MILGLKRGVVELAEHDAEWGRIAAETAHRLKQILGQVARGIEHVGSTSIRLIRAKPIIDMAVAVDRFEDLIPLLPEMEKAGFIHRPENDNEWQRYFSCNGERADIRTHHIHVVLTGSKEWQDYINFRDFLNTHPETARAYEQMKLRLMQQYKHDRNAYTEGKAAFIQRILYKARLWRMLGCMVTVHVDRPMGTVHPSYPDMLYPLNYGYLEEITAPDGEGQDVYVLGVDKPVRECVGRVVALIHRRNDAEDKVVVAPDGYDPTRQEIEQAVAFQERWFDIDIELWNPEEREPA